ncbi:hypothetical protein VKT23_017513 [Stygiomarasmius scandens]|uniref:Uncharacterized protein n=1 Tax=Marasmiellus scandens TaxID=2682957 RepID=A0ABR1IWD5_9AGAR
MQFTKVLSAIALLFFGRALAQVHETPECQGKAQGDACTSQFGEHGVCRITGTDVNGLPILGCVIE